MSATFDPESARRATAGRGRRDTDTPQRWGATVRPWLGPVAEVMLVLARLGSGDRVLDIVAGAGAPALAAAAQVGPGGYVLAIDIAPDILADAGHEARRRGLDSFRTEVADVTALTLADRTFDAALSRAGLVSFPDRRRALAELHRVLKPGGRVAAAAYGAPERNALLADPLGIIRRAAQLPPPAPGQPDPFSLAEPGALAGALREAGFRDTARARPARPIQPRRSGRAGGGTARGGLPRHRRPRRPRAAPPALGRRLRALRARGVRGVAPAARRNAARATRRGLAGDRMGAAPVRGGRRVRRPLRAAHRRGHEMTPSRPGSAPGDSAPGGGAGRGSARRGMRMFFELRQYRILPGKMAEWVRFMEEIIILKQTAAGYVIVGGCVRNQTRAGGMGRALVA